MIALTELLGDSPLKNNIVTKLYIILIYDLAIFIANFLILANVFLEVGMLRYYMGALPRKEGGTQVLADLAPSSQAVGSLLRTPWPVKLAK
jgi:hypothetical protein